MRILAKFDTLPWYLKVPAWLVLAFVVVGPITMTTITATRWLIKRRGKARQLPVQASYTPMLVP